MSILMMTIDKGQDEVFELVDQTVRAQKCEVEVTLGHISENGQHVKITGERSDLEKLKAAFEQQGESVYIPS